MRKLAAAIAAVMFGASGLALAAPTPQARQPQRGGDVRDLSPLPENPRAGFRAGEYSNDGIFAPAPISEEAVVTPAKKKSVAAPVSAAQATVVAKSEWERAIDRLDIYYNGFFNGPILDGARETTWNPWSNTAEAFYIYHALDFDFYFDRSNLVGFEVSGKQTMVARPNAFTGQLEQPSMQFNDPQFWYKRSGLISGDAFSLDTRLSIWPGMTSYSVNDMGQVMSAAWDTTWNLKFRDPSWASYFTTRVRPSFYSDIYRPDGFMREWMYLSAGYYVGYSLSKSWQVNASAVFDCMFYAQNDLFFNRNDSSADRGQLELNYNLGRVARIGLYVQAGIFEPSSSKATAGLDVTVNFL